MNIENSNTSNQQIEHGRNVTISCNNGYHLIGQGYLVCLDGEWDFSLPTCVLATSEKHKMIPV